MYLWICRDNDGSIRPTVESAIGCARQPTNGGRGGREKGNGMEHRGGKRESSSPRGMRCWLRNKWNDRDGGGGNKAFPSFCAPRHWRTDRRDGEEWNEKKRREGKREEKKKNQPRSLDRAERSTSENDTVLLHRGGSKALTGRFCLDTLLSFNVNE